MLHGTEKISETKDVWDILTLDSNVKINLVLMEQLKACNLYSSALYV